MVDNSVIKPKVFNGKYTLHDTESNRHWTFEIKTQSSKSRFRPGERLISLLSGPNNTGDWRAIGTVTEEGVALFKKHDNPDMSVLVMILWSILTDKERPEFLNQYEVLVSATCYKCNRELTVPESILTGIGPVCAERMNKELRKIDPIAAKRAKIARLQFLLEHAEQLKEK